MAIYFASPLPAGMAVTVIAWGGVNFAFGSPVQSRVLAWAADAPNLASALIPTGFNIGIAIGAVLGSTLLENGFGYRNLPWVGAGAMVLAVGDRRPLLYLGKAQRRPAALRCRIGGPRAIIAAGNPLVTIATKAGAQSLATSIMLANLAFRPSSAGSGADKSMLLDQISLLTAIGFSGAALMVTLFVSWLGARTDTYLLELGRRHGACRRRRRAVRPGRANITNPPSSTASFAGLLSGFALHLWRRPPVPLRHHSATPGFSPSGPARSALPAWLSSSACPGSAPSSPISASPPSWSCRRYEYWAGRAEAPLPMIANAFLYAGHRPVLRALRLVLLIDGQMALSVRPKNWAEDLNAISPLSA